jgi:cell growth-regulating nucleolar protein
VKPQKAYVEDAPDDYTGTITIVDPPPEAPSPPSAVPGFREMSEEQEPVNVFNYLIGSETPNPSTLNLTAMEEQRRIRQEDTPVVPSNADLHMVRFQNDIIHEDEEDEDYVVEYGSGPVPAAAYRTPAGKGDRERRKKDRDSAHVEKKSDKKRKRLHVDTSPNRNDERLRAGEGDEIMTDAPPVLHSGLTGGLNRLLSRPSVFPPSPDYSGGDAGDASPGSPLKRSKSSRRDRDRRGEGISNSIMAFIAPTMRKSNKDIDDDRPRKQHRRNKLRGSDSKRPVQRMIEYKPMNGEINDSQMVVYQERADHFLSFVNKGPESEKGCSMNKTLKRYHRERAALGIGLGKGEEEKELWRSLRFRKNDRGEIVVFAG